MNPGNPDPFTWSRRRFFSVAGCVLMLQWGALVVFSSWHVPPPARRTPPVATQMVTPLQGTAGLLRALPVRQPALLSLVTAEGLSGEAWLSQRAFIHAPADWTEPPLFLPHTRNWKQIEMPLTSATGAVQEVLEPKPPPVPFRDTVLAEASRVEFSGPIGKRVIRDWGPIPLWDHSDVLKPTKVEIFADNSGRTISSKIISASGLKPADEFALRFSKSLRYQIMDMLPGRPRLESGVVTFHWATQPLESSINPP